MTLKEIAAEYRKNEEMLAERIEQLEARRKATRNDSERRSLDGRLRILRSMHRDVKEIAAFTEHYHKKGYHSNAKYKM